MRNVTFGIRKMLKKKLIGRKEKEKKNKDERKRLGKENNFFSLVWLSI